MSFRKEARQLPLVRTIRTLLVGLMFALFGGLPATHFCLVQTSQADEQEPSPSDEAQPADRSEDSDEATPDEPERKDSKSVDEENKVAEEQEETGDRQTWDESAPVEPAKEEAADSGTEEPSAKQSDSDKAAAETTGNEKTNEDPPAKDDDQPTGDEVSAAEKAADEEEEARADEAVAEGAEVEVDESDDEEEEPTDSQDSPNRPAVNGDKPVKETPSSEKRVIGATATIMEKQSELLFRARVDSGAKSCSLHIEDYKIENESDTMAENIGKVITFHIKNGNGESHWLTAKIAGYVVVKTAAHRGRRYKVPLTLRYKDFEKTVLVTLNNREKMEFPLLLGRNFLMGDFVVDVEVDNNELHTR